MQMKVTQIKQNQVSKKKNLEKIIFTYFNMQIVYLSPVKAIQEQNNAKSSRYFDIINKNITTIKRTYTGAVLGLFIFLN